MTAIALRTVRRANLGGTGCVGSSIKAPRHVGGWPRPSPACWEPRWSRLGAIGVLLIWHLVRRGRLIQERLNPPRIVRMPELLDDKVDPHDQDHGETPTA